MAHRGHGGRGHRGHYKRGRKHDAPKFGGSGHKEAEVDENAPVIKLFRQYQGILDAKHDKHERVLKVSRDITIESKRTIFLLQRISGENKETVLEDAKEKLKDIEDGHWKQIAKELNHEDPYQYLRAYSPGLQEFIEALSFYYFLKEEHLVTIEEVEKRLQFSIPLSELKISKEAEDKKSEDSSSQPDMTDAEEPEETVSIHVHIPPEEYMLGVADLTGELMRMAILSVGLGNLDVPNKHCCFMRKIHDAFVSFSNASRELRQKLRVLRQSLQKVENACYTLQVRGSELPQDRLVDFISQSQEHDDIYEY